MKWPTLLLMFVLCFAGFTTAAHAGNNAGHAHQEASSQHGCAEANSSTQHQHTSKTDKSFCEAACHAPVMVNSLTIALAAPARIHGQTFKMLDETALSRLIATPDQPPQHA